MNKKIMIFAIIGILVISSVAINLVAALPLERTANRLTQATWVRINGNIDQFVTNDDTSAVRGQLQTQARVAEHQLGDIKQLTAATAIWTKETMTAAEKAKESSDFTYTYFIARLPDASVSDIDSNVKSPTSYILSGTWKVSQVVLTVTIQTNNDGTITKHRAQDITPLTPSQGTLTVNDKTFILTIVGVGDLKGSIYSSITRSWYNPFKMTDNTATNTITRNDVKAIGQNYGAMLGWGNYNTRMDFNNNYRVDIADISTVAANI